MQQTCHEVLAELGVEDNPVLAMAQELERIALEDEYFVEKRVSQCRLLLGRILKAIGIPVEMSRLSLQPVERQDGLLIGTK